MVDYRKEPISSITEDTPQNFSRFVIGFFGTVFILATGLIIASIYINPFGYFGTTGQFETYNARRAKAAYLLKLPREELPDAWIIGSSNMLPFQPRTLNRFFDTQNAFNLGSYWGRAEDLWSWTNFIVHDLSAAPKVVILGVEPWTFADDQRGPPLLSQYRRRLIVTKNLAKYLPEYSDLRYQVSRLLDSLTIQNMRIMARMVRKNGFRRRQVRALESNPRFNIDGTSRPLSKIEADPFLPPEINDLYRRAVERSTYNTDPNSLSEARRNVTASHYIRLDDVVNFLPGDRMQPEDFALFRETIALLHSRNIEVGIIMLPTHPYFYDLLVKHTNYVEHLNELKEFLKSLQAEFENVNTVLDASHIYKFRGKPDAFHDKYHMTPINTDLVLERLHQDWRKK